MPKTREFSCEPFTKEEMREGAMLAVCAVGGFVSALTPVKFDPAPDLSDLKLRLTRAARTSQVLGTIERFESLIEGVLTGTGFVVSIYSSTPGGLVVSGGGFIVGRLARSAPHAEEERIELERKVEVSESRIAMSNFGWFVGLLCRLCAAKEIVNLDDDFPKPGPGEQFLFPS